MAECLECAGGGVGASNAITGPGAFFWQTMYRPSQTHGFAVQPFEYYGGRTLTQMATDVSRASGGWLRQYMKESAKAEEDLVAVLQSAKNRPSPIDGYFGAVYYIGPIFTAFRGTPEATEYYRVLRGEIEDGKTILEAAQALGVDIEGLCGNKKVCGKCKVRIEEGYFEKDNIPFPWPRSLYNPLLEHCARGGAAVPHRFRSSRTRSAARDACGRWRARMAAARAASGCWSGGSGRLKVAPTPIPPG